MPLITPTNIDIDLKEMTEILISPDSGLNLSSHDDIRLILNERNASKEDAVNAIADIMARANKMDQIRLKAAELVLDLHGVKDKDGKINKQPVVNFIIKSDQVNIANIFNPQR